MHLLQQIGVYRIWTYLQRSILMILKPQHMQNMVETIRDS